MSHVDEGALHAYLDGALDELPPARADWIRSHLVGCSRCAARLELERSVRQDAERILSLAVPRVETPSFEEVRAYATAVHSEDRRSSSPRLSRLGWAASVVIAVGVGWLVRDGQLDRRPGEGSVVASGVAGGEGERVRAPETRPEAVEEGPSYETTGDARAPSEATGVAVSSDRAPRASEQPRPPTVAELPEERVTNASVPTRRPATVASSTSRTITLPAVDALTSPVMVAAPVEPRAEPGGSSDRIRVTTLLDAGPTGRRVTPAPAEDVELPEEAPMVVPGVELISIENLVEGTSPRGVHVVQRLRGGSTLDVYHLPDEAALSELPRLPAGHDEVRGRRGSAWVILRADLDRTTLLELLTRLNTPG